MKCATTNAAKTKGSKKCKEKNLFSVAFETLNPPQITKNLAKEFNFNLPSSLVLTPACYESKERGRNGRYLDYVFNQ
jgi:hypothetical protein